MPKVILITVVILSSVPLRAQQMLSSWEVRQMISNCRTKHYHRDTETFEKKKALAELKTYLTTNSPTLSDFDKVQIYTGMAIIETIQAGCKNDFDAGAGYMRKALEIANGRISRKALWCTLNISNIRRGSRDGDVKKDAYIGEACHFLFREALRRCTDKELRKMMMMPVGSKIHVEKMIQNEMNGFRRKPYRVKDVAESKYNRVINSVADAYWFSLLLRDDIGSEGEATPNN